MRNVVIDQKGCRLSYERQLLLVFHDSFRRPISIPFGQIQSLIIVTQVDISSNLLTRLAEQHITVTILPSGNAGHSCTLQGDYHTGVIRRQMQYEIIRDKDICQQWATVLVRFKIHSQYQLLQSLRMQYPQIITSLDNKIFEDSLIQLRTARRKLKTYFLRKNSTLFVPSYDLASLRGMEGSSASVFFRVYRHFFNAEFGFVERNRRPPKDPINTLLSLGYTLLQGLCEQAVFAIGFDPYLGILHEVSYGRKSLACDFAELQRHEIERWVWQLVMEEVITLDDFNWNGKHDKACELLKIGRSRFYEAWAKIRPHLLRQAKKNVWAWYRRIEGQFELTGAEAVVHTSLEYASDWLADE